MSEVNLFGEPLTADDIRERAKAKRRDPTPSGHAAPPGTGPDGETCKTCRHSYGLQYAKTYYKCALNRAKWTGGRKTDIRLRDPACEKWEAA